MARRIPDASPSIHEYNRFVTSITAYIKPGRRMGNPFSYSSGIAGNRTGNSPSIVLARSDRDSKDLCDSILPPPCAGAFFACSKISLPVIDLALKQIFKHFFYVHALK